MKFMQIKPQKARGKLLESMWTDPEWVAEEKYDGDRRIAQFCSPWVRFTGTRESVDGTGYVDKTANLPQLHIAGSPTSKLEGTVLDGEIVAPWAKNLPGGKSKYVTSIMGSDPERAIMLQKQHGFLEYMVFDCLWYKGQDVRDTHLPARRDFARIVLEKWGNKHAKLAVRFGPNKKVAFDAILKNGGEGVILKHLEHTYGDEKLWVKVKGEWTADCIITGFTEGKGKYRGQIGALTLSQYKGGKLVQVSRPNRGVSGFTDPIRCAITRQPAKYLGHVVEIMHNGREATGMFRHPRFKRFRPDKSPKDCVYREDET